MTAYSRLLLVMVGAIAALMVLPGVSALPVAAAAGPGLTVSAPNGPAAHSIAPAPVSSAELSGANHATDALTAPASVENRVLTDLKASHVPMQDAFLPNFNAQVTQHGDMVSPLYTSSPAPMGLGDFGIQDVNGTNVGTVTYAQDVKASVTLNSVDPLYVTSSAPDEFTMQLNTVTTNVDLFGNDTYQFWLQNVPIYAAGTQTLSFEDNIWNFSSPSFLFTANSIYAHGPGGVIAAPTLYFASGPSFHVPTPFTVIAYNNLTVVGGRSTVFFNYTVVPHSGTPFSGSYDFVEFNSTPGLTGPAPEPLNEINGQQVGDTDFLLNDAEIMLGGPGGGSSTTLFHISASMSLAILPSGGSWQNVPSAYDFGTDTGETSEGIGEYATTGANPVAELNSGPSILYPLWGIVGAQQGSEQISVHLTPSNAFVFANSGTTANNSSAAWAPTPISGSATYWLSPGAYTFQYLLSDYNSQQVTYPSGGTWTVSLSSNPTLGDYTPLWAESNGQLAAISAPGGAGTASNPYVLDNGPANVNPLFGELNDYAWPVFPGIYLIGTSAYVSALDLPAFSVAYNPAEIANGRLIPNGLPLNDQLNIELWGASHVSIVDSPTLASWFANFLSFAEPATVYLWNSSHNLIAGNTFYVESNGITLSGGHGNLIWGNVFVPEPVVAPNPGAILNYGSFPSIWEFEWNDKIFNNAFTTPVTALEEPFNFYNGAPEANHNRWNVAPVPASKVFHFNGWDLSGSILGISTVSGNYWSNYGTPTDPYGVLPYNDGGLIYYHGDYSPVTPTPLYEITFVPKGLPAGDMYSVTINGYTQTATGDINFWEPAGTYAFVVSPPPGWHSHPGKGAIQLVGPYYTVHLKFTT
jgi:thermopsin